MQQFEKLYKRDSRGGIREWQIEVDTATGRYRTLAGMQGGKVMVSKWTQCISKNVGRSNETTPGMQAVHEATAKFDKKLEGKWTRDISKMDSKAETVISPMLADKYEKVRDSKAGITWPVFSQPKFDGMRAIITADGAFSRGNKEWKSVPHITEALRPVFEKYPDLVLDGELYSHTLKDNFNKMSSLLTKTKPTPGALQESAGIVQYYVYDIDMPEDFGARFDKISEIASEFPDVFGSTLILVDTILCNNEEELDKEYDAYLSAGYEGQMVRQTSTGYENRRSKSLLKRKKFFDSEYEIIRFEEGRGNKSGMVGKVFCLHPQRGEFKANIKGTHSWMKELWENKDEYVGKVATVEFPNLTPDGIPRFGYVTRLRAGVGIDQ